MRIVHLILAISLLVGSSAVADVVSSNATGFKIVSKALVGASKEDAWRAAVKDVHQWWSPDHTMSGDARRLSIDAKPLGCFCEDLGKHAFAVHMTVTMVVPPTVLRLSGGLGPLGLMGVDGNMTWEFDEVDEQTQITLTYAIGGYREGGLDAMAAPVDGVLTDALKRLRAYIDTGDAEYAAVE
jgi:hypothetical protein